MRDWRPCPVGGSPAIDCSDQWFGATRANQLHDGIGALETRSGALEVRTGTLESHTAGWVNIAEYGAKGDGSTDDTAAIQAALNTGKRVLIPAGTYRVTSTLTWNTPRGLVLEGSGNRSAVLSWDGASGGDVLLVEACKNSTIRDLGILGNSNPSKRPTRIVNMHSTAGGGGCSFERVRLGGDDSATMATYGVDYVTPNGIGNDQAYFYRAEINHCTHAVHFNSANAKNMRFEACEFSYGSTGVYCEHGDIRWRNGLVSVMDTAAFQFGINNGSVIEGADMEECDRFVLFTGEGVSSPNGNGSPLTLTGNRFAGNYVNADGRAIVYRSNGPLAVRGNQLGEFGVSNSVPMTISVDAGGNPATAMVEGNSFGVWGSAYATPLVSENTVTQFILQRNLYFDGSGASIAGAWDDADPVSPPASSLLGSGGDLTQSPWAALGPTNLSVVSLPKLKGFPSGGTVKVAPTAGSFASGAYQAYTYGAGAYTLAAYVHAGTWPYLALDFRNGGSAGAVFDLSNGSVGFSDSGMTAATPVNLGGGWWLVSISGTPGAGASYPEIYLSGSRTANARSATWAGTETAYVRWVNMTANP